MRKIKRVIASLFRRFDRAILRGFQRFFRLLYKLKPLRPLLRPVYRVVHAHYRISAAVLTIIIIAGIAVPVLQYYQTAKKYALGVETQRLLGEANPNLTKKLTFDQHKQMYYFNQEAKNAPKPEGNPVATLKNQVGGGGKDDEQLYSVDAPRDLSQGVTYYDNQMDLNFKIIPQFATLPAEVREGHLIYPLAGSSGQVAYTVGATGLKQNVVLYESPGDALSMSYRLELPKTLEAKMIDETGDVGIYSVDPSVLAKVDYQASDAAAKLEQARTENEKTYLTFKIPAPVVMAQGKIDQASIGNIKSHFILNDNTLTVMTTGLDKAEYPLAIDPTVSIDSASEFGGGTAEDNNQTIGNGDVTRGDVTGGSVGAWSTTTALSAAITSQATVAYNGYLYVISGQGDGSTVRYAPINSDGTIGSWTSTFGTVNNTCFGSAAAYNGYVYLAGGSDCGSNLYSTIQYAKLQSGGSIATFWSTTTSLPTNKVNLATVIYNGYIYAIGGWNGSNATSDVLMAPIKADGSIGSWTTTTSLGAARYAHQSAIYNGYMYVFGGLNGSDVNQSSVEYASINADGTIGSWTATTNFTTARNSFRGFAYNGYLYVTGGTTDLNAGLNTVQYAPINANGSIGSWVSTTNITNGRWKHGAVAYNGYIYVVGGSQTSSSDTRSTVYYAKINPPGPVTTSSFTSGTAFTGNRNAFGSVAYNGYMYVLGGESQLTNVRYSAISANGSVGTWNNTTALNTGSGGVTGRSWHSAVAYNGYMYALGGVNSGGTLLNSVQYVAINNDGTLGTSWATTSSFTTARDTVQMAVAYNGYMYILGGVGNSGTLNDVQYAAIGSTGTLGAWNSTTSFTTARSDHSAVAYNGYMYIMGGTTVDGNNANLSDVQYAPINTDGTIGSWSATTSLGGARKTAATVIHNGYIYHTGGSNGSGVRVATVQYAAINSDGTIGSWVTTTSITGARTQHAAVTYGGYLYALGGVDVSDGATNTVYYAPLNNSGPGTTGTWNSTSSFTNTRYAQGTATWNGYMYILGGYNNTVFNDVQYAPINRNGTLGSWSSAGSGFTNARYGLASFALNGYLYVLGGYNGSTYYNDVQYAPICPGSSGSGGVTPDLPLGCSATSAPGSVGTWNTTTSFTTARYGHHIGVYNGRVYLTGGSNGTAQNTVQYASINADGTLGSWTVSGNTFTNGRYGHGTVINNGYIYVLGGNNSGTYYNDVRYAAIDSGDGSVGTWAVAASPFVNPRYGVDAFAYNGYMYVLGGYNGSTYYNDVQYAPIAPNGHLGQWQKTENFTTGRYVHTAVAYNGYMYVLGGGTGSYLNTVQYAPINVMSRKATYSKILDLSTLSKITNISYTGNLPGGLQNIRYRLGNGQYSLTNKSKAATERYTCDAGYYAQVFVTLDDTNSSVFPDSSSNKAQLSSITITTAPSGAPPELRLKHGAWFAGEEQRPLETGTNQCES